MEDRIERLKRIALFENQPLQVLKTAAKKIKEESYPANFRVIQAGKSGRKMFIIKSGQVKVISNDMVVDYLGPGNYFGEMSPLTGMERSADVITTLDTVLYSLDAAVFIELVRKHPTIAIQLSRVLAMRLVKVSQPQPIRQHPPGLICINSNLSPIAQKNFSYLIGQSIKEESNKKTVFIDFNTSAPSIFSILGIPEKTIKKEILGDINRISAIQLEEAIPIHNGIAIFHLSKEDVNSIFSSPHNLSAIIALLKERFNFIILDHGNSQTFNAATSNLSFSKCLDFSDSIIYFVQSIIDIKKANQFLEKNKSNQQKIEVMAQNTLEKPPTIIRNIYSELAKKPTYRLSVSENEINSMTQGTAIPNDLRRIARRISGVSLGVAIGGGGAKSCAGIGLLKVLEEENIPVDIITGSSGGALVALFYSHGLKIKDIIKYCKKILGRKLPLNPFPLSSLYTSNAIAAGIKESLSRQELFLEELKIPTFLSATDILRGEPVSFSHGPATFLLAGSAAMPAIFNPIKYKNYILIDGAVSNIVPSDILVNQKANITIGIIMHGINKEDPELELKKLQSNSLIVKLAKKLPFFKDFAELPPLLEIVNRSILIPALMINEYKNEYFDFLLKPNVLHYKTLDAGSIDTIVEEGIKESRKFIPQIKNKIRELKSGPKSTS